MGFKRITITLSDEKYEEINNVSRELNEKKSRLISKALDMYMDYLDLKLAVKRAEDYEEGNSKAYSIEEARKVLSV